MGQALIIASGKGGVGKTTVSAGLSAALAARGRLVVAVDANFGLRNLDTVLGLDELVVYDLYDVATGVCDLDKALISHPARKNLWLLPGSWGFEKTNITAKDVRFVVDNLLERFDYVVIDCPAGIDKGFQSVVECAQRALVIATPDQTSVKDAAQVANILRSKGISDIRLIINKVKPEIVVRGLAVNLDEIIDRVCLQLISVLPDDDTVLICANRREPATDCKGPVASELNNLAARLEGESIPLERFCAKRVFNRLFG